jgi:RNA-directed DNA polymerase
MHAKLKMIKAEMWRRMHQPIPKQGQWLWYVVRGYFNYHAVPTNARALHVFRHHVIDLWRRTLRRRHFQQVQEAMHTEAKAREC